MEGDVGSLSGALGLDRAAGPLLKSTATRCAYPLAAHQLLDFARKVLSLSKDAH